MRLNNMKIKKVTIIMNFKFYMELKSKDLTKRKTEANLGKNI